jgi:hypothetical protein
MRARGEVKIGATILTAVLSLHKRARKFGARLRAG